jgi:hypothetical protein
MSIINKRVRKIAQACYKKACGNENSFGCLEKLFGGRKVRWLVGHVLRLFHLKYNHGRRVP